MKHVATLTIDELVNNNWALHIEDGWLISHSICENQLIAQPRSNKIIVHLISTIYANDEGIHYNSFQIFSTLAAYLHSSSAKMSAKPKFNFEKEGHLTIGHVDESEVDRVAESFKGRSLFITGGTGFLGKVLVEKLLR